MLTNMAYAWNKTHNVNNKRKSFTANEIKFTRNANLNNITKCRKANNVENKTGNFVI